MEMLRILGQAQDAPIANGGVIQSHEGLRGLAALMVALFHVPGHGLFAMQLENIALIANAWIFVDLFFLLSGFVLFWSYGNRLHNQYDVSRFMMRRIGRLYPLHLATLVLFSAIWFGLQSVKWLASVYGGLQLGQVPAFSGDEVNWFDFVLNLFLLQGIGIRWTDAFNYPAWSVSMEMWMYCLFACVVAICALRRTSALVFAVIGLSAVAWYWPQAVASENFAEVFVAERHVLRGLMSFSAGVVLASARLLVRSIPSHLGLLQLLSGLLAVIYVLVLDRAGAWLLTGPLVFGLLIFVMSFDRGWLARLFMRRPLAWLGKHSYSIYMLHATLLIIFGAVARYVPPAYSVLVLIPYLVLLLALSSLSYQWIEAPMRDWFRRLAERRVARPAQAMAAGRV